MSVIVRRVRWPDGASEKDVVEAAKNSEKMDVNIMLKRLLTYFKAPDVKKELIEEMSARVESGEFTPSEAAEMYCTLCFYREDDIINRMEVGDSVYIKLRIYWTNPVQYASYVFEYDLDSDEETGEEAEDGE